MDNLVCPCELRYAPPASEDTLKQVWAWHPSRQLLTMSAVTNMSVEKTTETNYR